MFLIGNWTEAHTVHHTTSRIGFSLWLLLLCIAPPSSVQSGESPPVGPDVAPKEPYYRVCHVGISGPELRGKLTVYISGPMLRAKLNDADYGQAFAAFLAEKYGITQNMMPRCLAAPSLAEAQKAIEQECTYRPAMRTCVKTGWTYPP